MFELLNFLASIAWYGWITIALIWMFIGLGLAELQIKCAERDVDSSKDCNDCRCYYPKAHKLSPWTYLAFPMIALRGKSYYCDARYHDMDPFHVKMAVVGAVVLMYNMACLAILAPSAHFIWKGPDLALTPTLEKTLCLWHC